MKKLFLILVGLLAIAIVTPTQSYAQKKEKKEKKEKEKKEKKPWTWEMPELTGNKNFDEYLLSCDTLNSRIQSYSDSIVFYHVAKIKKIDNEGNPVLDENGNQIMTFAVVDDNNVIRSSKLALLQYADIILTGTNIILDAVTITAQTATATLELPNLGLKALSYAKYVKAGPKMVSYAGKELKEINEQCKLQRKRIRAYKKGFTESGELQNPDVDITNIDGVDLSDAPEIEKESSEFDRELAEAISKDATISDEDADVELDEA